jgi:hypothetical protein
MTRIGDMKSYPYIDLERTRAFQEFEASRISRPLSLPSEKSLVLIPGRD